MPGSFEAMSVLYIPAMVKLRGTQGVNSSGNEVTSRSDCRNARSRFGSVSRVRIITEELAEYHQAVSNSRQIICQRGQRTNDIIRKYCNSAIGRKPHTESDRPDPQWSIRGYPYQTPHSPETLLQPRKSLIDVAGTDILSERHQDYSRKQLFKILIDDLVIHSFPDCPPITRFNHRNGGVQCA
ncbi:MAG: hypothetical protein U0T81_10460 [Saprospiraceae bacterium]